MRKLPIVIAVIAGLLLVSLLQLPAAADRHTHRDPNDTPGRLDIKSVSHGHDGRRLVTKIRTFGEWGPRHLRGRNRFILVSKANGEIARGTIWWRNGGWWCKIPDMSRKCSRMPGVSVYHPNRHTLVIKNVPHPSWGMYRYRVATRYRGHVDWAPRKGVWITHRL